MDHVVRMSGVDRKQDGTLARMSDLVVPLKAHKILELRHYGRMPAFRAFLQFRLALEVAGEEEILLLLPHPMTNIRTQAATGTSINLPLFMVPPPLIKHGRRN